MAARRYIGDAAVTIEYVGGPEDEYEGSIRAGEHTWQFDSLFAPRAGFAVSYDSPEAYDAMAASAVSFAAYYASSNRGDDTPDWAPEPEVADTIEEATEWARDDQGEYEVRRRREDEDPDSEDEDEDDDDDFEDDE
jgi:hypothetical protein